MASSLPATVLPRHAFVTIGATASFRPLLSASLSHAFLESLLSLGYTHLTVQYGPDLDFYNEARGASQIQDLVRDTKTKRNNENEESDHEGRKTVVLSSFDFNKIGLGQEMRVCKGIPGKQREGVVVCHAGAGTILDAMRIDVPIIVVPNPALLDNHQSELAEELQRQGYVIYGALDDLPAALEEIEKKSESRTAWNVVPKGEKTGQWIRQGVGPLLDEELGYEDRTKLMEG